VQRRKSWLPTNRVFKLSRSVKRTVLQAEHGAEPGLKFMKWQPFDFIQSDEPVEYATDFRQHLWHKKGHPVG